MGFTLLSQVFEDLSLLDPLLLYVLSLSPTLYLSPSLLSCHRHDFLSYSVFKKLISSVIVSRHCTWNWLAALQPVLETCTQPSHRHTHTHTPQTHLQYNDLLHGVGCRPEAEQWQGFLCALRHFTFSAACFLTAAACSEHHQVEDGAWSQQNTTSAVTAASSTENMCWCWEFLWMQLSFQLLDF